MLMLVGLMAWRGTLELPTIVDYGVFTAFFILRPSGQTGSGYHARQYQQLTPSRMANSTSICVVSQSLPVWHEDGRRVRNQSPKTVCNLMIGTAHRI